MRYRHGDSDFVRVARQQDFLRDLREQISPENVIGQLDAVAKAVGRAIVTAGFSRPAGQVIELAKLIGFSQGKPLRQVKFRAANSNYGFKGQSYVTTTPALERATLDDFLNGTQKVSVPKPTPAPDTPAHGTAQPSGSPPAARGALSRRPPPGEDELVKAAVNVPFRVLYPSLQTGPAVQQPTRAYDLRDTGKRLRHAYVDRLAPEHASAATTTSRAPTG